MVLLLILNVTNDGRSAGFADAECSVAALPGELALPRPSLLDPSRRVCLDDSHAIGHGKVGRQASQQVNMIGCAANGDGDCIELPQDAAEIGVNVGTDCVGKERRAVRRGKNNVNEKVVVGLRHSSYAPPGLRVGGNLYTPGLRLGLPSFARYAGWARGKC